MAPLPLKLALLATAAAAPVRAGSWRIEAGPNHAEIARQVKALLPEAQAELEATLGLRVRGGGLVVLCPTTESFREATPGMDHRHTLGVAYPRRSTIYLNCQAVERAPYENFAITLRHELSHVVVGEVVRRGHRRVPLWFDEGLAVWTSGKVPLYNPQAFELAVRARSLPPLAALSRRFPENRTQRGVAYEQSESFVRYLVQRHGIEAVRQILRAAARGVEFETAFRQATGQSVEAVEEEWLAEITPGWPWARWWLNLLFHPYSAFGVFGVMTLLALLSFWLYLRRRRRKYEEWEVEERDHESSERSPWD
ncbi:MAG: peptidase MA family metallohydrolase [bacterium]